MLVSIIRKEILLNLLSYKFSIIITLSTILILVSIFVMYRDYGLAIENYEILASDGAAAVIPPTPLSIFAKGLEENLCRAYVQDFGHRISAKTNVTPTLVLVMGLVVLITGIVFMGVKLSRR